MPNLPVFLYLYLALLNMMLGIIILIIDRDISLTIIFFLLTIINLQMHTIVDGGSK